MDPRGQIEHKRLKVQHKKDKERDRYVAAPSPRIMGPGPAAGRVQQPPQHFRQPLLPQHNSALRHHPVRNVSDPDQYRSWNGAFFLVSSFVHFAFAHFVHHFLLPVLLSSGAWNWLYNTYNHVYVRLIGFSWLDYSYCWTRLDVLICRRSRREGLWFVGGSLGVCSMLQVGRC